MEPIGYALDNIDELWVDPYLYSNQLSQAVEILHNRGLKSSIYNFQLCILPKKMHKFASKSISEWKNIYLTECENCDLLDACPGFFASSSNYHSRSIKLIKNIQA